MIRKKIDILYEDNHLLIVNKKVGVLVQGDKTGDVTLLDHAKEYLKIKYSKPGNVYVGLAHRIDRPVSGIVLLCKTSKCLSRLTLAFKNREIKKTYWAIVTHKPPDKRGKLIHWLQKNNKLNKVNVFTKENPNALRSELDYEVIFETKNLYLIQVIPITGRPHQIRAQLSKIDLPVSGDIKYGDEHTTEDNSIYLHSRNVEFFHPVTQNKINITAPLPGTGLWKLFKIFDI